MQLKAIDIANKVISLEPHKTLYDARNIMLKHDISRVVITEGNNALGIITEKDMVRILYIGTLGASLHEIELDQAMTKNLITVSEHSGLNICARIMYDKGISSVITVNENNEMTGIITKSDLVNVYANHYLGKSLVRHHMTRYLFTVEPDETIRKVLSLMVANQISRVVVVKNRKPVGVITGRDLLPISLFLQADRSTFYESDKVLLPSGTRMLMLASDLMTSNPITIAEDSDLAHAAQLMKERRISGLPVIDSAKNISGLITKTDVIRAFMTN